MKNVNDGSAGREISENYLEGNLEKFFKINAKKYLANEHATNDKTKMKETIGNLKEFKFKSLLSEAKRRKGLVAKLPANKKQPNLLGDEIMDLETGNEILKNKRGDFDHKWFRQSR